MALGVTVATNAQTACTVDALAFRNVRHYDSGENLLDGNMAGAVYIQPGDPVPGGMNPEDLPPVLIANGTPRPLRRPHGGRPAPRPSRR